MIGYVPGIQRYKILGKGKYGWVSGTDMWLDNEDPPVSDRVLYIRGGGRMHNNNNINIHIYIYISYINNSTYYLTIYGDARIGENDQQREHTYVPRFCQKIPV